LTQPASFSAHTDEASVQFASVVSINHQKTANQPASFYNPRRNFNFVARDSMNHQENHKENQQDFSLKESKIFMEKLKIFTEKIKIFIGKITNH